MNTNFFIANRQALAVSVSGGSYAFTSSKVDHGGIDANFWYLTGIEEPGWQLVYDGKTHNTSYLIEPVIDDVQRIFDGSLDHDVAKSISGVDEILDSHAGEQLKKKLGNIRDCTKELATLRAIKQPAEIEQMERAAKLTTEVLDTVKARLTDYTHEYQIEADISHYFRWRNARHAFDPIVGSGHNACTLHYGKNSSEIAEQELVLIDVGARVGMYAADVTRTYSVGKPTVRQSAVHGAVQLAERKIISLLKPGLPTKEYVKQADVVMKEALLSLGLMKRMNDEAGFRRYFPHAVSHGLGIDVHESLGGYKELRPGMVLTVEPGMYIPEEGIGVRLEDDILITENGQQNLTVALSTDL